MDCENFLKVGRSFELRDVATEDHLKFVSRFAEEKKITFSSFGGTVYFNLPKE